jgi:hypothetical protein
MDGMKRDAAAASSSLRALVDEFASSSRIAMDLARAFRSKGRDDAARLAEERSMVFDICADGVRELSVALDAHQEDKSGHDADCESELTSHGYTPCRCFERAGICYCRKQPCECLTANTDVLSPAPPASSPPERSEGWQPIETAPKDGTRVDLCAKSWLPAFDRFESKRFPDCVWMKGDPMCNRSPYWLNLAKDWHPTHWMPLPALPPEPSNG